MENINLCTKYILDVNESILSNNMKLFCLSLNSALTKYNSNGFVILDNSFKIPHHALIYTFAKSFMDEKNKSIDDYKIILRACHKTGRKYFDSGFGYGEYHAIQKSNDIDVDSMLCDFLMFINFNNCDDIVTIATDLNKKILDNEPNINELYIFRSHPFTSLTGYHMGNYFFKEVNMISIDNLLINGLYSISLEFVNKNNDFYTQYNYPNMSDIFKNEQELYEIYDKIYNFYTNKELFVTDVINMSINDITCIPKKIEETVISISDNLYFKELLERYNYTFEKLYKSMFPGEYSNENFIIEHYPEVYYDDSTIPETDINIKSKYHRCSGLYTVPTDTKKILLEINEYIKMNEILYIKIIR